MSMFSSRRAARSLSRTPQLAPSAALAPPWTMPVHAGEQHAALREEVEVGPLVGEDEGIAHGEGGHAADAQRDAIRDTDQRAEQRERLGAGLGHQAVADPDRVEEGVGVGLAGEVEHLGHGSRAEKGAALGQGEAEAEVGHGGSFGVGRIGVFVAGLYRGRWGTGEGRSQPC